MQAKTLNDAFHYADETTEDTRRYCAICTKCKYKGDWHVTEAFAEKDKVMHQRATSHVVIINVSEEV